MIKYSLLFLVLASSCISEPKKKTITDSKIINNIDSSKIKKEKESMNDSSYIVKKDNVSYSNDNKDLNSNKINNSNELIGSNELFELLDNSLSYFKNWCNKRGLYLYFKNERFDDSSVYTSFKSNDGNRILSKTIYESDSSSRYITFYTKNLEEFTNIQFELIRDGFNSKRIEKNDGVSIIYYNEKYLVSTSINEYNGKYSIFIGYKNDF